MSTETQAGRRNETQLHPFGAKQEQELNNRYYELTIIEHLKFTNRTLILSVIMAWKSNILGFSLSFEKRLLEVTLHERSKV